MEPDLVTHLTRIRRAFASVSVWKTTHSQLKADGGPSEKSSRGDQVGSRLRRPLSSRAARSWAVLFGSFLFSLLSFQNCAQPGVMLSDAGAFVADTAPPSPVPENPLSLLLDAEEAAPHGNAVVINDGEAHYAEVSAGSILE